MVDEIDGDEIGVKIRDEKKNSFYVIFDLSFASTETKLKNPITKTQKIFLVNTGFLVKLFQKKPK